VVVVESFGFRRQRALECGADAVVDSNAEDAATVVRDLTHVGADIVVDAAGTLLSQAISLVRRGGRVILFGMNQHTEQRVSQYEVTRGEISVYGSFIQRTAFPKVIRILESASLPLDKLVTHQLPSQEIGQGLDLLRKGEALKAVIRP